MLKKHFLACAACIAAVSTTLAADQKTVKFDFQTSQARLLDVNPSTYVRPLIAELSIIGSRIRDKWELTTEELNARWIKNDDNATLQNLRSYAVFKSSEKHNCDVIVAATFDIHLTENGAAISIVGYPASFSNWATGTNADYNWITIERGYTQDNTPTSNSGK